MVFVFGVLFKLERGPSFVLVLWEKAKHLDHLFV